VERRLVQRARRPRRQHRHGRAQGLGEHRPRRLLQPRRPGPRQRDLPLRRRRNAATYVVYESFAVDAYADSSGIVGDQGGDTLTLITCGGTFSGGMYDLRVIVRASRAG
jgi:hypothetical protein